MKQNLKLLDQAISALLTQQQKYENLILKMSEKIAGIDEIYQYISRFEEVLNSSSKELDDLHAKLPEISKQLCENEKSIVSIRSDMQDFSDKITKGIQQIPDMVASIALKIAKKEIQENGVNMEKYLSGIETKIYGKIDAEIEKAVENALSKIQYRDSVFTERLPTKEEADAKFVDIGRNTLQISHDNYVKLVESESNQVSTIKKINTQEIRNKLMEAIQNKNDRQSAKIENRSVENPDSRKNIEPEDLPSQKDEGLMRIVSQIKLNMYNLPFFFDGESIFGVFKADHTMNFAQQEDEHHSNAHLLNKLHIWPQCAEINYNIEDMRTTKNGECEIYFVKNGMNNVINLELPICEHCVEHLYRGQKGIKISFNEFLQDFISGNIQH